MHLKKALKYQNWIAWDGLSFPVRLIMPSHYTILCFSKGLSKQLPGLAVNNLLPSSADVEREINALRPIKDGFCFRNKCVAQRNAVNVNDRDQMTDLWGDIHRIKHNSRRVDHPTQLPPQLMYRLISLFTQPGEVVLDCFDGSGTTSLSAHQLKRQYIGIELSEYYANLSRQRHEEIRQGIDPFRKHHDNSPIAKNSPVPRLTKQKYAVPKKTLQLEVKKIAGLIGHIPSKEELLKHSKYPIEYFEQYFVSWGEVCAAARTTGMSEKKVCESTLFDLCPAK
jgi:site-specific DNA-methyltransferase (adenine-specific)